MMLKRLERPSLMVVWTGLSRVVVERAHADSLLPFCGVVGVEARLALGRSVLLDVDNFLWSLGEPYLGEQQGRSNLLWTTGEYCILRVFREGEEMGVPPPFGVRQRWGLLVRFLSRSVWRPTLMVWVVCVPRVVNPLVWQAVSRTTGPGGERMAFLTEMATSFMSSLKFLESCRSSGDANPTVGQMGDWFGDVLSPPPSRSPQAHLPLLNTSSGPLAPPPASPPPILALVPLAYRKSGSWAVWCSGVPVLEGLRRTCIPQFSALPAPLPLSGDLWQWSGLLKVLVVRVALVVRNQAAGWNGSSP